MNSRINSLVFLVVFLSIFTTHAQNNWPFRDENGAVIRGNITGTVGDYRSASGGGVRFHAGVDFTSPLVDEVVNNVTILKSRAVYSMHTGTAVLVNSTGCLNDWIEVTLSNGEHVFYKHVNPTDIDPVTGQTQTYAIPDSEETLSQIGSTPVSVVPGTFLGLMVTEGGTSSNCEQHVHINANTSGQSLEGGTNFIYNFVDPFSDNRAPDFMYPFNSDGEVVTETNGNNTTEFRMNGHLYDNTTTLLNTNVQIDNASHKVIYDKVDIVSRMRDRKILANGEGAEQGNNGINSASFELIDATDQSVMQATGNISFSHVPPNDRARYVFDDRSVIGIVSRHVYIRTGNTHITPYDRYFNTRLKAGQIENYNLNTRGIQDALCPLEAAYKDGKYKLRLKAFHISNQIGGQLNPTIRDTKIVIDNFKPFVEKVVITSSGGDVVYDRRWTWNRTTSVLTFGPDTGDPSQLYTGRSLRLTVWTSESMSAVTLSIPTLGINNQTMQLVGTQELRNNWAFDIPLSATQNVGLHQISIAGTDLNSNTLQRNPALIVKRLPAGGWEGTVNAGTDINHSFTILSEPACTPNAGGRVSAACQVEANFMHAIDATTALKVNFTDQSTPSAEITSLSWEFGDGSTSTAQNPSHTYSFEGEYTVTLTAFKGTEQNSYSKIISVSSDLNPIFSASTAFGQAPLTVEFNSQASTGPITSRSWIISPSTGFSFVSGNLSSPNPILRFNNVGTYEVKLKVFAGTLSAESNTTPITVQTSSGPIVNFDWDKPVYRDIATHFDNKTLFPCLTGIEYYWTFNEPFGREYTSENVDHAFISVGTWDVTLCVSDGCGGRTCATKSVEVKDATNAISTKFTADKVDIRKGETITFYDQSTPRSDIVAWEWLFEVNGNHNSSSIPSGYGLADKYYTSYKPSVTHLYNKAGIFKARLYATVDPQFLGNHYDVKITVNETPELSPTEVVQTTPSGYKLVTIDTEGNYLAAAYQKSDTGVDGFIRIYKKGITNWNLIATLSSSKIGFIGNISLHNDKIALIAGNPLNNDYKLFVFERSADEWLDSATNPTEIYVRCFGLAGGIGTREVIKGRPTVSIYNNTIALLTNEHKGLSGSTYWGDMRYAYVIEKTSTGWPSDYYSTPFASIFTRFVLAAGTSGGQIFAGDNTVVTFNYPNISIFEKNPEWSQSNVKTIEVNFVPQGLDFHKNTILLTDYDSAYIYERPSTGWSNNQPASANLFVYPTQGVTQTFFLNALLADNYASIGTSQKTSTGTFIFKTQIFKKSYSFWTSTYESYSLPKALSSPEQISNYSFISVENNGFTFYDFIAFCQNNVYENDNVTITSATSADVAAGTIILGGGTGTKKVQINNGAVKKYMATQIKLKPGFNAKTGSTVSLSIKSCDEINLLTQ
jgi:PKD repeat protein